MSTDEIIPAKEWFDKFVKSKKRPPLISEVPFYYPAVDSISFDDFHRNQPFRRHIVHSAVPFESWKPIAEEIGEDCFIKWGLAFFTDDEAMAMFILKLKE